MGPSYNKLKTMEKEIEVGSDHFSLYYEGVDFEGIDSALNSLYQVFEKFLSQNLKIESSDFSLNLSLCSSEKIIQLNNDYRSKDKITDVLSFPIQENLRSGDFDDFLPLIELGDIYICEEVCQKQAEEYKLEFREEFLHLAVHGFLHLCGYDHEISATEEEMMEKLEEELLLNITNLK